MGCDHISVCICTYKRPEMLRDLLSKLTVQVTDGLFSYSVVVVDNDAACSARNSVLWFRENASILVEYYMIPEQNIALVRNEAIEKAKGTYIAFIDDDEMPVSEWLLQLYRACSIYCADGALGPVIPKFEQMPPQWVIKGRVFERPSHKTGQILQWQNTRTGNVLLKQGILRDPDARFRREFGSGGEDRDFFRRMIEKGHRFAWCNEASVYENIPQERWNRSVLIKRALLRGKVAFDNSHSKPISVLKSVIAIMIYTAGFPLFLIMGHHIFMKYLIKDCDHLGKVFAFLRIELVKEKYVTG
jgi:succinoglycan biosynthesis protein ExoM